MSERESGPERIARQDPATVRYQDPHGKPKFYRGKVHGDALDELCQEHDIPEGSAQAYLLMGRLEKAGNVGFMTESGRFVNRTEAEVLASLHDQISPRRRSVVKGSGHLLSEDLDNKKR